MSTSGIYGLSGSGLDIDSLVKVGMLSQQNTYDKMYQKEIKNTWIKDAYVDIYNQVNSFKDTMSTFNKQSAMSAMKASSSSTAVTATANADAAAMNHKVTVDSVASNAYLLTEDKITRASGSSSSYDLKDVAFQSIEEAGEDGDGNTLYNVTFADGTTEKNVKATATAISFTVSDGTGSDANTATISYTYADLVDNEKTLYDLATDIASSGVNITAKYDSTTDSFSLYNKNGGSTNSISLKVSDSNTAVLFDNLHLKSTDGTELSDLQDSDGNKLTFAEALENGVAIGAAGTNGSVTIDGKKYENLTSNSLTVAGVIYTFNEENVGETATISVSQDTDKIVENVKSFVEAYNTLLDSLQEKYSETAYSDYKPLTKTQESQMTQEQIEQWNEKAKSGLLYHDSTLRDLISDLREAVATQVSSVDSIGSGSSKVSYNSASALGITTSNNKGHLTLDEDTLNEALAADPDCVYQVFGNLEYETDKNGNETSTLDFKNSGIANRLYFTVTTDALDVISDYAGTDSDTDDNSYLGNLITNMLTQMSTFKTQMSAYEELLYDKYDRMESAISTLGTQLNYITGSSS